MRHIYFPVIGRKNKEDLNPLGDQLKKILHVTLIG